MIWSRSRRSLATPSAGVFLKVPGTFVSATALAAALYRPLYWSDTSAHFLYPVNGSVYG